MPVKITAYEEPKAVKPPYEKNAYNRDYNHRSQIRKQLYFNRQNSVDMSLLSWVMKQRNFTRYIKDLIRRDMEAHGVKIDPAAEAPQGQEESRNMATVDPDIYIDEGDVQTSFLPPVGE